MADFTLPTFDYQGLLDPGSERQSAIRGLLAYLGAVGAASGPSPTPRPFGAILGGAIGPALDAEQKASDLALRRTLTAAQVGQVAEKIKLQQGKVAFVQGMANGTIRDTPANRALATAYDIDTSKFWGPLQERPYDVSRDASGRLTLDPGATDVLGQRTLATEVPKAGVDIFKSFGLYHPPVPLQPGGGLAQGGASGAEGASAIEGLLGGRLQRMLSPGLGPQSSLYGSSGSNALIGGSGSDDLTQTRADVAGASNSYPLRVAAQIGGTDTPPGNNLLRSGAPKVLMAPSKDVPGVIEGEFKKGRGGFANKIQQDAYDDAKAARNGLMDISQMRAAMQGGFHQGWGAETANLTLAPLLQAVGVKPETMKDLFNWDPANARAFQSASNQLVMAMLGGRLGAQISDADRNFVATQVASIKDTPEAAKNLLQWAEWKMGQRIQRYREIGSIKDPEKVIATDLEYNDRKIEPPPELIQAGYGGRAQPALPPPGGVVLPEGIPAGSRLIGTKEGKPVYQTPTGKRLVVE